MAENDSGTLTDAVNMLASEIAGLRGEIQDLDVYGRQSRLLIQQQKQTGRRQWIIIAVLVASTIVALHASTVASHAASGVQRNAVNAEQACKTGNIARATTRDLWDGLFKLPSIPPLTPAQQAARDAQIATVRARIATSYADQDCTKLGPQAGKK